MRKFKGAIFAIAFACGAATAAEPIIDTIAGGGTTNADGIPAKQATLIEPYDIAFDAAGNLYIADACRIRKVSTSGVITTIAGNGLNYGTVPTNGTQATSGPICSRTVAVDVFGYVYYYVGLRVGKISPTGVVTIVAGNGLQGYEGDGGPATSARLTAVDDIALDAVGNVYISDANRVRKIATNGVITTFAGKGTSADGSPSGDYGPATAASINPGELAFDRFGNLLIIDEYLFSVRKVDTSGMITTIWGAAPGFRSDPIAFGTDAYYPTGLATDAAGNVYVANRQNFVSAISPQNAIRHVVGTVHDADFAPYGAWAGFEGDGGPAIAAKIREPGAVATDAQGNLYIADTRNARVRKVTGPIPAPVLPAGAHAFDYATPQHLVSANQYTVGIVKGDANADGRADLFLLTGNSDRMQPRAGDWSLHVYRQTSQGTLAAPVAYPLAQIEWADVMAIDLNHDRYTDIVFGGYDINNVYSGLYVMLGGANGMAAPVRYTGISGANGVGYLQQADMNRDGHMDVLAWLTTGGDGVGTIAKWAIYYGNGTGALVSKAFTPVTYPRTLVRDFNDDGWPDMLFGWETLEDSGVAVAYHDGVNNFHPQTTYPGVGAPRRSGSWPVIADFNRDGVEDLIFSIDGNAPNAKLTHWVRKPGGGFDHVGEWGTYDVPQTLIAEDMNNDGFADLLIRHSGWSAVGYMQQTRMPDGRFWLDREVKAHASVDNQAQAHSMTVGDFNSDDCLDIAVSGTHSGLQIQYGKRCLRVKKPVKAPIPPRTLTGLGAGATGAGTVAWAASPSVSISRAAPADGRRTTWVLQVSNGTVRWVGISVATVLAFGWAVGWRRRWLRTRALA